MAQPVRRRPGIVGRDVRLNGDNYRVVGVMPEGFFFPDRQTELWTPFAFTDKQRSDNERGHEFSDMVGRLAPGATIAQLDAQMDAIIQRNVDRVAGTTARRRLEATSSNRPASPDARARCATPGSATCAPTLWLLQALVACVLLIACANVANLRADALSARQKEMSVRTALGAGRMRIARQLLIESLLLALAGGAAGIALAYVGVDADPHARPRRPAAELHASRSTLRVLLFSLALALAPAFCSACARAVALARDRPPQALREGGRGTAAGPAARALRNALVVVQIALAVALLGGAGLLVRSFCHVQQQSPGFVSDDVLSATIDLPQQPLYRRRPARRSSTSACSTRRARCRA